VPLHYAVLAQVSLGYSPPGGRLPTCYSPGRHSTYPRRGFRVRLACVRHAASVDSEPGSNSQLKSWPSLSLSRKMTVLLLVTPAKLSERLVRFYALSSFQRSLVCFCEANVDYTQLEHYVNRQSTFYLFSSGNLRTRGVK
jgi:hypothetical protein